MGRMFSSYPTITRSIYIKELLVHYLDKGRIDSNSKFIISTLIASVLMVLEGLGLCSFASPGTTL